MKQSLDPATLESVLDKVGQANQQFDQYYPGETEVRQPVHTVYGGAHLFKADTISKLGALSLRSLDEYAPDPLTFGNALGLVGSDRFLDTIYSRVKGKLEREAVEDFRIDFEDGFGNRPNDEEDRTAVTAAQETARALAQGTLSPYIGIRIKPFTEELKTRSARTLDIFVSTLLSETGGKLPPNFVVTLPKVTIPEQVTAFVQLLELLEQANNLSPNTLKMELMIETTQSIINRKGEATIPSLVAAAKGRCVAAHFGTYDYTASCSITAQYQVMDHPSCDYARHMMKVTLAGTGIWLSDGATNVMPVGPNRPTEGKPLTEAQLMENRTAVYSAWRLDYDHIRHSLKHGFYQGWDLHPAQFPVRYAACYAFFLEGLDAATERLSNFIDKAAQATLVGNVFDDAATGQGLLNYFLRALNCGAITEEEVLATGLTLEEVRGKSFVKILDNRSQLLRI